MQSDERVVAKTIMDTDEVVSTVFLGLDHGFGMGPSLFFETLILGGPHDGYMVRYPTWELAEVGHHEAVSKVLKGELL